MPCKSRTAAKPQASPTLTPARSFRDDNAPGRGRRSQTQPDKTIALTCRNTTQWDAA